MRILVQDLILNSCLSVLVSQSCPTLCDPVDSSPLGSSVHGILQARILEWAAVPFLRGSSQSRDRTESPSLKAYSLLSEPPGKINSYISLDNSFLSVGGSVEYMTCLLRSLER